MVDDPAADVFVEPEDRPIGFVFQDYVLFEHLTVLENVAYGMRARGVGEGRGPTALTSGSTASASPRTPGNGRTRCRVVRRNAWRWLVRWRSNPRLLLLDEPLAALDAGTRAARAARSAPAPRRAFDGMRLVVTHDPVDAHALADRVVVLEAGRIVQAGTLAEVTAHPRTRYVADLVGVNLVVGDVLDGVLTTPTGARVVIADAADGPDAGDDPAALGGARARQRCRIQRPEHVERNDRRHRSSG